MAHNSNGRSVWQRWFGGGASINTSLLFDKVNDYVQLNDTTFLEGATTFSVSFWYKNTAATFNSIMMPFSKVDSGLLNGFYTLLYNTNWWSVHVLNGSNKYRIFKSITNQNSWQHYGWVYQAGSTEADKIRMYWNAIRRTPDTSVTPVPASVGVNGMAARIGCSSFNSPTYFLGGNLKNFAMWSDAVDQNVIDMGADINATPNPTNLIRHWTCNGVNPSTVLVDSKLTENGTLVNFDGTQWRDYP